MSDLAQSGVTAETPGNIMLGAGTIHKGLKYTEGTGWNFVESCLGATSGGNKFTIKPEIMNVEVDGASVKVKDLTYKVGEEATMEINFAEISPDIIKTAVFGKLGTSDAEGYEMIISKPNIETGDYFENIAFVGKRNDGIPIIVIMENALCTSGLEVEGKKKEGAVIKLTFECYQKIGGDLTVLPYKIYYPTQTTEG